MSRRAIPLPLANNSQFLSTIASRKGIEGTDIIYLDFFQ